MKDISDRDIAALVGHLKEADNYCVLTDKGVVLFNRDITAIKISFLERLMKECVDKFLGVKVKEN